MWIPTSCPAALRDMLSGEKTLLTKEEVGAILNEFQRKLVAKRRALQEAIAATNKIARRGVSG